MTKLTTEEKALLDKIMNNIYAVGPFSGMIAGFRRDIANKGVVVGNETTKGLVKETLQVRLIMEEMAKDETTNK